MSCSRPAKALRSIVSHKAPSNSNSHEICQRDQRASVPHQEWANASASRKSDRDSSELQLQHRSADEDIAFSSGTAVPARLAIDHAVLASFCRWSRIPHTAKDHAKVVMLRSLKYLSLRRACSAIESIRGEWRTS